MGSSKPVYVLDATAIIHFAKIDKLSLIVSTCEVYITREVYREVVDRGEGKPDAFVVHEATERGQIKIYDVHDLKLIRALRRHPEIHAGEAGDLGSNQRTERPRRY